MIKKHENHSLSETQTNHSAVQENKDPSESQPNHNSDKEIMIYHKIN